MQNRSHAVMAQRIEAADSADDFPTPPWATRGFMEHIVSDFGPFSEMSCLETACGAGHMSKVLKEYFGEVRSSDAHQYGYGAVRNYLDVPHEANAVDWVITNPPFRLAEQFVQRSLIVARRGVAVLVRTVFIESVGRYQNLFQKNPPNIFAQYTERVPMVRGRLDRKASTATGYAWLIWTKRPSGAPRLMWVPPCRKSLERETDYPSVPTG